MTTRLLQQTRFWSQVKRKLGWTALAFDLEVDHAPLGDVLLLARNVGSGRTIAYSPFGPEPLPDEEARGMYLAALSSELRRYLGGSCIMVRWDLPWRSPYAEERDRFDDGGNWLGPPETRIRELRMNWGAGDVGLRKAPTDVLPPDTFIVDIRPAEDEIQKKMKAKTRYNIGLAFRRGVRVRPGDARDIDTWMRLYAQTARRNSIVCHSRAHFEALLGTTARAADADARLLIAEKGDLPLAAMYLSTSSDRASYLYGASSDEGRSLMAPYALQWEAIRHAKRYGCTGYDLFGSAPNADPDHPMHGLYRFKSGFGGIFLHRQGSWDYPFDQSAYSIYIARESASAGFHR